MASSPLPIEIWQSVTLFLPPKDVLSVLSVNQACSSLGQTDVFWKRLYMRDNEEDAKFFKDKDRNVVRRAFLTHSYKNLLPSVRWYPLRSDRSRISSREGHSACVIKNSSQNTRRIVVTGGFSDDEAICK